MHGVNKGDRVAIYMPMIMETPIAMLACSRIGAIHSIVVSLFHSSYIHFKIVNILLNYTTKSTESISYSALNQPDLYKIYNKILAYSNI